jgi:hypothetical protein
MKTWTCNSFKGYFSGETALVVTADDVKLAITMIETQLIQLGLQQTIKPEQLIPLTTHHRHVRLLSVGITDTQILRDVYGSILDEIE